MIDDGLRFPPGFVFGTATASYQIEGAVTEDGRGVSVWDTFSHTPGTISGGDTGDVACDSYHRYGEDIALMTGLGVQAYRFSVAWPRIVPTGSGPVNQAGLDYYKRLADGLREAGIEPAATLFHWDLPQPLQDVGGWLNRDTAARFADYASVLAEALGDRVGRWITLNEPVVVTWNGHIEGSHAPGLQLGAAAFPVAHHQLLGHGLAVAALRAATPSVPVGITNNYGPCHPATDEPADVAAAAFRNALHNHLYTDPILLGRYPELLQELTGDTVQAGDLETISAPIDFLGVNYYFPELVRAEASAVFGMTDVPWPDPARTAFGWPVVPAGLTETLTALRDRYENLPPLYVTENGAAYDDEVGPDGAIHDKDRVSYLDGHLRAVKDAIDAGVDVRGYYCWSLLDNFEWAQGFSKRFGLVRVDFDTLTRTPKDSYGWYRDLIAAQ
ncbi:MAG TPA: GH1 family beta-glucosidase [Mycobacteriales bacterium]|nr:GH1 family beta-glucosidase [Mycobacteriales bacterium]